MNVKFLKDIPFKPVKSRYLLKQDINLLPQVKELNNFITDNNVVDVFYQYPTDQHDMIVVILNNQYFSLRELKNKIFHVSQYAKKFLYLSINKFYVYSETDNINPTDNDYDLKLVDYCCNLISDQFTLLKYTVNSEDQGTFGNFIHPVTTLFFKKND